MVSVLLLDGLFWRIDFMCVGAISFDTFVQGVKSEPALVDILNLYNGLV